MTRSGPDPQRPPMVTLVKSWLAIHGESSRVSSRENGANTVNVPKRANIRPSIFLRILEQRKRITEEAGSFSSIDSHATDDKLEDCENKLCLLLSNKFSILVLKQPLQCLGGSMRSSGEDIASEDKRQKKSRCGPRRNEEISCEKFARRLPPYESSGLANRFCRDAVNEKSKRPTIRVVEALDDFE